MSACRSWERGCERGKLTGELGDKGEVLVGEGVLEVGAAILKVDAVGLADCVWIWTVCDAGRGGGHLGGGSGRE